MHRAAALRYPRNALAKRQKAFFSRVTSVTLTAARSVFRTAPASAVESTSESSCQQISGAKKYSNSERNQKVTNELNWRTIIFTRSNTQKIVFELLFI